MSQWGEEKIQTLERQAVVLRPTRCFALVCFVCRAVALEWYTWGQEVSSILNFPD